MKKTTSFFPGRLKVSFRKGPSGHLRQDPSQEAMNIKKNPALQDKTPPQSHEVVKTNAVAVTRDEAHSYCCHWTCSAQCFFTTVKTPLPVPPQLLAIAPQLGIREQEPAMPRPDPTGRQPTPPVPAYDQDVSQWNCSQQQKIWMKTEMEALGLWPGSCPVRHPMNMLSLWRFPPQPEMIDTITELPSPTFFQLHPFFIWKPDHPIMERLRNNYILPCLHECLNPQVASSGVGRPRVIIGTSGPYYILASRLTCKVCKRYWHADKPQWLEKLPKRFTNIVSAFLTHKKAICKSVMDELRHSGRSPEDMAKQLTEVLHLKYERAHLAYLLSIQNTRDAEAGVYGQKTITGLLRQEDTPAPFGGYSDTNGCCGESVSSHYLVSCLVQEYRGQKELLTLLLQGTFGRALRSDHTRKRLLHSLQGLEYRAKEHLVWDCWRTTEAIIAAATTGLLANNSTSMSKFTEHTQHHSEVGLVSQGYGSGDAVAQDTSAAACRK
ncbi:uncharacterized protein V6R79_013617 [Siganus canaliculatus]